MPGPAVDYSGWARDCTSPRDLPRQPPDRLPFVHAQIPAYRTTPGGLQVPCDGPHLLGLDADQLPICSTCRTRVVRTGG